MFDVWIYEPVSQLLCISQPLQLRILAEIPKHWQVRCFGNSMRNFWELHHRVLQQTLGGLYDQGTFIVASP